MKRLDYEILKVLAYSSVFGSGLDLGEIKRFLGIKADYGEIMESLNVLLEKGVIFEKDGFYALKPEYADNAIKNREVFKRYIKKYKWALTLIYAFPFVRGVFITGSVASGYPAEGDDIDVLMVCGKGRLYTCRLFVMLFVKFFPKICPNFFIAEDNLEFKPEDYYVCRELAHMIPVSSKSAYKKILCKNSWIFKVFPNFYPNKPIEVWESKGLKRFLEVIFSPMPEKSLMELQIKRFMKKGFKGEDIRFNEREFKPHKEPHRKRIMERFSEVMSSLS
ncbi:MAG: hypothetical protein ABIL16_07860 [candidate division WOR-3 bacterium]